MSPARPDQIAALSSIRQMDLLALPEGEQERELSAFGDRLQAWTERMKAAGAAQPGTVSVEIPVFKGGWVMPCIESVLYQTSTDWSVSIRWDGGDALSRRILEVVDRLHHPKIQVYFGENRGIAYNRRFLTEHSQGEFIVPLDDDDMLALNAVERFLGAARRRPWSGIIRARRDFIDEVGRPVESDPWFPFEPRHYQYGMVQDLFNHSQPTLISRSAYARTSGWEGFEEFRFAGEDCDLFIKIEEVAPIELLDEVLYFYRISDRRTSLVLSDSAAFEMWRRLADAGIARLGLPLKRTNDRPPYTYERLPRPALTTEAIDVVTWAKGDAVSGAVPRNEGFARTTRPLVCFVEDGIELRRETLDELLNVMQQTDADLVGPGHGEATWLPSPLLLVRREVMNAVGGFEPGRGETVTSKDFSLKARQRGFTLAHAEGATASVPEAAGSEVSAEDADWLRAKWEDHAALLASMDAIGADFRSVYDRGNALAAEGRTEDALAVFQRVSKLWPKFSWAHHSMGDALGNLERWQEAANAYRRAIQLKPEVSWSHHHLGNVLSKLGRPKEAIEAYRKAIELEPGVASGHKNLGLAMMNLKRYEEARAAFDAAIALDPGDFWSHYGRGDACSGLRCWTDALESFQRAIELGPDVPWAHINAGKALFQLERWEESIQAFRAALALKDNLARRDRAATLVQLANSLSKLDQWQEVIEVCQRAAAIDPELFWAYQFRGVALLKLRRWAEAEEHLRRAIALDPDFAWSHHYLGDGLVQLERLEEAVGEFRRAVELDPELYWSHNNLGETLLKLGRIDEAVAACRVAVATLPDLSLAHHNLGDALVASRRLEEAAAAYQRADEINPDWTRRDLGTGVARLERRLEALAAPRSAATAAPQNEPRMLFVLDSDYGELTTAMYLLLGQELAQRTRLLLPPRLQVTNTETLPGRTGTYWSLQDVLDEVEAFKPSIVVLASGYLYSLHGIFEPAVLKQLVDNLAERGCQVMTADPFLGLLSNLGTTTRISIDIPDDASPQLVRIKAKQDARLMESFSKAVEILRHLPHLYPVFPAAPGASPRTDEVQPISFFNPELLLGEEVVADAATPQWVFVLASRDYEVQVIFHSKDWLIELLATKIEETLQAGRHPVFVGPYGCVQALIECLAAKGGQALLDGVTLLTFCPFKRFSALLLNAEYVFYWNALSHSMFLRLFNERPVFLFDRGHLVRNVTPLYERIVDWYYQGWEPLYLDQEQRLDPAALQPLAEAYRRGAHEVVRHARRSPSPADMVEQLRAGMADREMR